VILYQHIQYPRLFQFKDVKKASPKIGAKGTNNHRHPFRASQPFRRQPFRRQPLCHSTLCYYPKKGRESFPFLQPPQYSWTAFLKESRPFFAMTPDVTVLLDANLPGYPGGPPHLFDGAFGADALPIGRG
jgi:hypothetical protein